MRYFITLFIIIALPGCFYAKVKLTEREKVLLNNFRVLKTVVLHSGSGLTDTVDYISRGAYKSGFVSNFHVWIENYPSWPKIKNRPLRTVYYSILLVSRSSFTKRSPLDLYVNVQLDKFNNKGSMLLTFDIFEEEFFINKLAGDTVVCTKRKFKNCPSGICYKKIVWSTQTGILEIEQEDGTVWKP